jgi:lipoprotein-anchoring transpeptidase ErfK/SrfK
MAGRQDRYGGEAVSSDASGRGRTILSSRWLLFSLAGFLALAIVVLGATTWAYGDSLRDEQRLLPGTTIATVDVGGLSIAEAIDEVQAHLTAQLDRVVTVSDGDQRWEITARELGADSDADQVVAAAFERTSGASLTELARIRWAGADAGLDLDVVVALPDGEVERFVDGLGDELDLAPVDAELRWTDEEEIELIGSVEGRSLDREASVGSLTSALNGSADTVELELTSLVPSVTSATAQQVADEVEARLEAALDHAVTVRLGDRSWRTSPRDLGATPAVEPLLEAGIASGGDLGSLPELDLGLSDDAVAGFVASIASEVDRPARDAAVDYASGEMKVTPERDGLSLDRASARRDLATALRGGADQVTATTSVTKAAVTSSSFDRLLYLDQSARRVALVDGGEVVRSWPVAVGMGGSPTPTGTFTVGAKRYEPTWYNPAQDRWGSDMPAQMGPGPDNPLGARAINWNRNGRDTLIRFHGTPNEDSIGEAASRGCVRMYNADVIELYDLVSTGMTIVSVRG